MIKTLTLSIDEIRQLIEISDADQRSRVLQSLTENATTPPTEIAPEDYADVHPMALRLAEKIRRKAEAAQRRRQNRQKQPAEFLEPEIQIVEQPIEEVRIMLDEATVDRLLWLKENHKKWRKAINCITEYILGSSVPRNLRCQIQYLLRRLFEYLDPLIRQANKYYSTPKELRPIFASFQK